jgi:hypothetical protein
VVEAADAVEVVEGVRLCGLGHRCRGVAESRILTSRQSAPGPRRASLPLLF